LFLKPGLVTETANPQRNGAKCKHSIEHQGNDINRKFSSSQNSKKVNENTTTEGRNANSNKISKEIERQRKGNDNNFVISGKARRKPKPSKQFCSKPVNDRRKRSPANRRVALIKEHLERINEHIERANAQGKRAHEENAPAKSHIPQNKSAVREGNKFARVDTPETRVVKQTVRVEDNTSREDKHVYSSQEHVFGQDGLVLCYNEHSIDDEVHVLGGTEHVLGDEEHDVQGNTERACLHGHVHNSTLTREYKEVARDTNMMRKGQVNELLKSMNDVDDRMPESSYEQEPAIITRKIRKMWTTDFQTNFPIIQSQDDKKVYNRKSLDQNPRSACNEGIPNKNSEIEQQPLKCEEIVRERIYLTGGIQRDDYFAHKAILELKPETGTYTTREAMCSGRYNHGIAQLGNEIYLVGGNSGFFEQLRSAESYSPKHEQWTIKPSMHEARDEFSLAVCDGFLYAIGGHNGIQDLRSVERFDARENSWRFVSPMRNYRAGACAVAIDDR
jgi:hypothetical protein